MLSASVFSKATSGDIDDAIRREAEVDSVVPTEAERSEA